MFDLNLMKMCNPKDQVEETVERGARWGRGATYMFIRRMDEAILPTKPKIYQWCSWTDTMDGTNVLLVTTRLSKERFVAFFQ